MATLWVTEFDQVSSAFGALAAAKLPPVAEQKVAFGTPTAALGATTVMVRLRADASCSVHVSDAGDAATTTMTPLDANEPEYFLVAAGKKINAIANP
jgi:hypothetical protein